MQTPFDTTDANLPAEVLTGLSLRDCTVLGKLVEGRKPAQIAKELGLAPGTISSIINSPPFKRAVEAQKKAMFEQIARGEFGALAVAKQEQEGAMRRIVKLAKRADDERVRFNANVELLKYGTPVPKQQVTESVDRLIDQMTAEEADLFARERVWPDRFKDQLARLATNVIKSSEAKRYEAKVDVIEVGENGEILG